MFGISKYIIKRGEKMSTFVLKRNYELTLPTSYIDINNEEMEYVDGGGFSWSGAKTIVYGALAYVLGKFIAGVTSKLLESAIVASAAWIKGAIDTAILTVMCYPEKVAATAIAIGLLGAAGYGIYKTGKSKKWW